MVQEGGWWARNFLCSKTMEFRNPQVTKNYFPAVLYARLQKMLRLLKNIGVKKHGADKALLMAQYFFLRVGKFLFFQKLTTNVR